MSIMYFKNAEESVLNKYVNLTAKEIEKLEKEIGKEKTEKILEQLEDFFAQSSYCLIVLEKNQRNEYIVMDSGGCLIDKEVEIIVEDEKIILSTEYDYYEIERGMINVWCKNLFAK